MRVLAAFLVGSLALSAAFGATTRDSPSPREQLSAWAGHWKIHSESAETPFGHAQTADYEANCFFLPRGTFLVCDYLSLQPHAGRITNDLSLFYYNDLDKTLKHVGVGAEEGGAEEETVLVDGKVWTRTFEIRRRSGGVADARFVYTFVAPDKQLCRFEISTDKGEHWTLVTASVGTKES